MRVHKERGAKLCHEVKIKVKIKIAVRGGGGGGGVYYCGGPNKEQAGTVPTYTGPINVRYSHLRLYPFGNLSTCE